MRAAGVRASEVGDRSRKKKRRRNSGSSWRGTSGEGDQGAAGGQTGGRSREGDEGVCLATVGMSEASRRGGNGGWRGQQEQSKGVRVADASGARRSKGVSGGLLLRFVGRGVASAGD